MRLKINLICLKENWRPSKYPYAINVSNSFLSILNLVKPEIFIYKYFRPRKSNLLEVCNQCGSYYSLVFFFWIYL